MANLTKSASSPVRLERSRQLGSWYVAEFRYRTMSKWWGAILAFGFGNPVLFLLSVGLGIGILVDANVESGAALGGVGYLQFLAPALLAAAAIQGVMDEVTFPTLDGFVWEKGFFAIQNTPITPRQIANGVMLIAMFRGGLTTVIYLLVLLLFGAIPASSIPALFLAAMFAAVGFAAVMMSITARLKEDEGFFAVISRFVVAPMFLFSGTFYPLELMPIYLQWIGWISPLWHATELGRFLSYGAELGGGMLPVHLGYFAALLILGMWATYRKFDERLGE
jgi:lipooligosaccharide transport system permease protein